MRPFTSILFAVIAAFAGAGCRGVVSPENLSTAGVELIERQGGRVDWSTANQRFAFDRKGEGDCYDVYVARADGTDEQCVSCGILELGDGNVGQPAWHPSGRYLVVQVEKTTHPGVRCGIGAHPGVGVYNDLWVIDPQQGSARRIHEVPLSSDVGVLHPHYSRDGRILVWAEMEEAPRLFEKGFEFGLWSIRTASVAQDGTLSNLETHKPNGDAWYETHGFGPGRKFAYTASERGLETSSNTNIYVLDLDAPGAAPARLTDRQYNEHAHFSPDGTRIVWMSGESVWTTDFWQMSADGTGKRRLTSFNDPETADYMATDVVAADLSWIDDRWFLGYVHRSKKWEVVFRIDSSR